MICKTMVKLSIAAALVAVIVGCKTHPWETDYHKLQKVQVQFYAPPGATVTLGSQSMGKITADRAHQIGTYGSGEHKLEHEPEQTATFNLSPGDYEFKYTAAGWKGVSVYGELEICRVSLFAIPAAKDMLKRCFIPIALPAPATLQAASASDDMFPYQSPAHRLKISHQDVDRLAAGDMITKVVFIADLKKAKKKIDDLEVDLVKLKAERQRLQGLLNEAQLEWMENPSSKRFIGLRAELTELDQKMRDKEDRRDRLEALCRADNVLIRREMLVLATDELLPKHEDPVDSARKLGQVVLIMRIGGRHMHWGLPAQEAEAFNQ